MTQKSNAEDLKDRFDMDGDGDVDATDLHLAGVGLFTWANANRGKAITLIVSLAISLGLAALGGDWTNALVVATDAANQVLPAAQ